MTTRQKAAGVNQTAYKKNLYESYFNRIRSVNKKFPPYGRQLFESLQRGVRPSNDIFIFLGDDAWQRAKLFSKIHWATLLPNDGGKPNKYRWDFVKGYSVLIIDTSGVGSEIIRHLAYELLKSGAIRIIVILVNYTLVIFRQGNGHG